MCCCVALAYVGFPRERLNEHGPLTFLFLLLPLRSLFAPSSLPLRSLSLPPPPPCRYFVPQRARIRRSHRRSRNRSAEEEMERYEEEDDAFDDGDEGPGRCLGGCGASCCGSGACGACCEYLCLDIGVMLACCRCLCPSQRTGRHRRKTVGGGGGLMNRCSAVSGATAVQKATSATSAIAAIAAIRVMETSTGPSCSRCDGRCQGTALLQGDTV